MRYNHFDMLPERAFLKVGGRITLEGGGSGGGGQTQSTGTTYQTNIPAYLEDPTKGMVSRGTTLSEQGYIPYSGQRVSGLNPMQMQAYGELGGMSTPSQFGRADQSITGAEQFGAVGALRAMGYNPTQFNMYQMEKPGEFGATQAQQYMSPYQQSVTDIAKREATAEAAGLNRQLSSQAAKAGAFGGSRFGVEQALLGSKLATNLADIQTKGLQSAYENAQQQYERDRAAGMTANQANLQAALTVQQQQDAARQAAARFNLEGAQFGSDTGFKSASALQNLGTAIQTADLQRIAAQEAGGKAQQDQQQQELNTAYNQWLEQRDWEKNQLGFLSGLIRGTPFSTSQTGTTTAPTPSTTSQLAGLGIAGVGLANLLK